MKRIFIFVLIYSLFFCGCCAIDYHVGSVDRWGASIEEARKAYEEKYLGKTKEFLLKDLGEPRSKREYTDLIQYDEEWYFNFSSGFFKEWNSEPTKAVRFYIKDEKVIKISVF